jgi:aryl-alcohol dehydrogenase-like predicted oxidoreductase
MSGPERLRLAPGYEISRVIRGGWQLAGGHGAIDTAAAVDDLIAAYDAGITSFDCADIYTGVEEIYGAFRRKLLDVRGAEALAEVRIHTKMVPDLSLLDTVTKSDIEALVDRSRARLGMERLDLVQFHWWDYDAPRWLDAFRWLEEIRLDGRTLHVGGTNFDAERIRAVLAEGVDLFSMQVQFSVLDARPETHLVPLARDEGIALFCYGSVAGGFLSERWLGVPEPAHPMENRSLTKYKLIIDDFGGWDLFQTLLRTLAAVGARHGADIATVAGRYVLDRPGVAAIIVGARNRAHVAANAAVSAVQLTAADTAEIDAVLAERQGPEGDIYALERDRTGRHGSIMKYELNTRT